MNAVLIAALAAVLTGLGGFFYGQHTGKALCEAAVARDERVARLAGEAAQTAAAKAISEIEVKNVTQRQVIQREIVEKPVYRDCRHSPDGLRAVNDALAVPGSPSAGGVPGADSAR
jgi:hypothetical protein